MEMSVLLHGVSVVVGICRYLGQFADSVASPCFSSVTRCVPILFTCQIFHVKVGPLQPREHRWKHLTLADTTFTRCSVLQRCYEMALLQRDQEGLYCALPLPPSPSISLSRSYCCTYCNKLTYPYSSSFGRKNTRKHKKTHPI